jgi:dTMP kinase
VSGLFVTIEGGEGVGKSTQARLLADRLRTTGATVVQTREPGGTPAGDRIRSLLLEPGVVLEPLTELFLYEASRVELMSRVIAPALAGGSVVICDRFIDSTTAYQAFGRGLEPGQIRAQNLSAAGGVMPGVTVLLRLDLDEAMARATHGGADRMECESLAFHRRVVEGFRVLAAAEPGRFITVDAAGEPEHVASRLWDALELHPAFIDFFGEPGTP